MTVEEAKEEFGDTADILCKRICTFCTTDWYCPSYCRTCEWVQKNYEKAIQRLAELDGDLYEFGKRAKTWK